MTAATARAAEAGPRGHVQIPPSLLYSEDHGGLGVWVWAMYETLMPHGLGGGRAPAVARRRFVAERAGASTSVLDDARWELLASVSGGPYLSRSTPRGAVWERCCAHRRRPDGAAWPSWSRLGS